MTLKELEVIAALDGRRIEITQRCMWDKNDNGSKHCLSTDGSQLVYEMWENAPSIGILVHRPCNNHLNKYLSVKGRFWKVVQSQ